MGIRVLKAFVCETEGAVTVDWVVLTAALVGLAVVTANSVHQGATDMADDTATALQGQVVVLGSLGYAD